jgi:hypothetical protein
MLLIIKSSITHCGAQLGLDDFIIKKALPNLSSPLVKAVLAQ